MLKWVLWAAGVAALAVTLDRVLLHFERKGWIFYRRTRGLRGRAMYHAQELDSILVRPRPARWLCPDRARQRFAGE